MCTSNTHFLIRRYNVTGSRTLSNYCWGTVSLIGGFSFFLSGLYSYYYNAFSLGILEKSWFLNIDLGIFGQILSNSPLFFNSSEGGTAIDSYKILFFPQGLSMCFYGLVGLSLGVYIWFCILLKVGCGFTEFNKETGSIKIFRLGLPGKNRFISYTYTLENIQSICVKIPLAILPASKREIYIRLKVTENIIKDIPLQLYSGRTSLENIELEAADLSKFLRVSLLIV